MSDLLDDLEQSQLAAKARTSDRVGDMPTAPPLCDHAFQLESPREPSLQETRSSNDPTYRKFAFPAIHYLFPLFDKVGS